ncbi:heme exporter protein CcmD [Methylocella silvestris BL2]|uniref:Heme exporter protein D n=1 Tax=Methylocella silvestris (strain DSM 15510 / CIP 108128 / LMG 27833 / NCIMB 13906 / BL2) TaxID=395965 RepID=B8ETP1_METSB|nr:heme exporter protein CcmD [Methylocella silvestris]ACK52393.1 heme exporter protein CcmD [Methylocella silvestris BL2]
MTQDPHFLYVVAAYALGFVVIGAMILSILLDYSSLRRALARFPQRASADDPERPAR